MPEWTDCCNPYSNLIRCAVRIGIGDGPRRLLSLIGVVIFIERYK